MEATITAQQRFKGFPPPAFTQVPDVFCDFLMQDMTLAELRVMIYLIRRTFGFRRDADTISLSQMLEGRKAADGRVLDRGTGLRRTALVRAIRSLEQKGFIVVERRQSSEHGNETNVYRVNVQEISRTADELRSPSVDPGEPGSDAGASDSHRVPEAHVAAGPGIRTDNTLVRESIVPLVHESIVPLVRESIVPLVRESIVPLVHESIVDRHTVIDKQSEDRQDVLGANAPRTEIALKDAGASLRETPAAKPSRARTRTHTHAHAREHEHACEDASAAAPEHEPANGKVQPFDLLAALCDELGADVTTLSQAERKKQLAAAKRLLAAGATPDDIRRETRWLRGQPWVDGVDLFLVEKQRAKWLLAGKPETARTPPAAWRPPARSRDEEARDKIAAFLRIANGEEP